MKHLLLLALIGLGLLSCSAKQTSNENNADSAAVTQQTETGKAGKTVALELTDKGVGPIVLGMKVTDIPASVAGLYDRVQKVTTPDYEEYQFFAGETALFAAEDPDEGIITGISLFSESPIVNKSSKKEAYIRLESYYNQ